VCGLTCGPTNVDALAAASRVSSWCFEPNSSAVRFICSAESLPVRDSVVHPTTKGQGVFLPEQLELIDIPACAAGLDVYARHCDLHCSQLGGKTLRELL